MNIEHFPKIWLPRTGQTTSYAAGDDGDLQAGNPRGVSGGAIQATRFIDNLNGTISDRATGLQWVKTPELIIPGVPAAGYSRSGTPIWQVQRAGNGSVTDWATSQAFLAGDVVRDAAGSQSTACNITDVTVGTTTVLTVDNIQGLTTGNSVLVNGIDGTAGSDVLNGNRYYVKVDSAAKTLTPYAASLMVTGVNTTGKSHTDNTGTATRCKFYVCILSHTSGTFADDIAGPPAKWALSVWTASASNITTANARMMDWATAVSLSQMSYAGYADWRLPNVKELHELYDYEQAAAVAGINALFVNTSYEANYNGRYWSSNTYRYTTTSKYAVYFLASYANRILSTAAANPSFVRPVRGGRINA